MGQYAAADPIREVVSIGKNCIFTFFREVGLGHQQGCFIAVLTLDPSEIGRGEGGYFLYNGFTDSLLTILGGEQAVSETIVQPAHHPKW